MNLRRGIVLGVAAAATVATVAAVPPSKPKVVYEGSVTYGAQTFTGDQGKHATLPTAPQVQPHVAALKPGQPPTGQRPQHQVASTSRGKPGVVQPFTSPEPNPLTCDPASYNNRWDMCNVGTFTLRKIVITNGVSQVKGTATARATTWVMGGPIYASDVTAGATPRSFYAYTQFDQFATTGDWNTAPLRITGDTLCDTGPCTPTDSYETPDPVSDWRNGPRDGGHRFVVAPGSGTSQVAWGTIHPYMAVADDSPNGGVASVIGPGFPPIRCDTTGTSTGCVFPQFMQRIDFLTNEPNEPSGAGNSPSVAWHIWDAWHNPSKTVPIYADKSVPGEYTSGRPLHRIGSGNPQYAANRSTAVSMCQFFWGTGYTQGGTLDCDEFPFASTREGAAEPPLPNHNYSARPLSLTENRRAGNRLGQMFNLERVIPGDPFNVAVFSYYS